MAIMDLRTKALPSHLIEAAKGYFRSRDDIEPVVVDEDRYKRLLEHELDRQCLSKVEQDDMDALNRVRAALYDD